MDLGRPPLGGGVAQRMGVCQTRPIRRHVNRPSQFVPQPETAGMIIPVWVTLLMGRQAGHERGKPPCILDEHVPATGRHYGIGVIQLSDVCNQERGVEIHTGGRHAEKPVFEASETETNGAQLHITHQTKRRHQG